VDTDRVTLALLAEDDFAPLRDLAATIWHEHYAGIVPAAQIDFMLGGRFADGALREYFGATDRWLDVLRVGTRRVGYTSSLLPPDEPDALKLGQLYLLAECRGRGLGRLMLRRAEERASALGRSRIWLQVNKQNTSAQAFYRAAGFTVREAAVFEIGGGFVMDDYLMEKRLA